MKYYLAITTSVLAFTSASLVRAEDCAITDCSALGYTESSNQGNCLKCPFGNAWACPNIKPEWGKCNGSAKNCNIGDILYSDGTCSPQKISGKTPIAVVVYKSDDGKCAQAMALKSIGSYRWGPTDVDIPTLTNFSSKEAAFQDLVSCENTAKIIAVGDKSKYPAAWAAHEYKTVGTEASDWCLPAAGIMNSIKNNIELIDIGYGLVNSWKIGASSLFFWSSSEYSSLVAWYAYFSNDYGSDIDRDTKDSDDLHVRPVLEF